MKENVEKPTSKLSEFNRILKARNKAIAYVYLTPKHYLWVKKMSIDSNQTISHVVDRCIGLAKGEDFKVEKRMTYAEKNIIDRRRIKEEKLKAIGK